MKPRWHTVYAGLGSNKGDRIGNLARAVALLAGDPLLKITDISSLYETSPVGPNQRNFINAVIKVQTLCPPHTLLSEAKKIEKALGRSRSRRRWGPRTIDIDILFYDTIVLNTPLLTVPHPELEKRRFVLVPLAELAPRLRHPVSKITMKKLCDSLSLTCPRQKVTMINKNITKKGAVRS